MKSKITIDVDWDNQPIIKIEYNPSEDVRDTLVKRFLDAFGGDSSWAKFRYMEIAPGAEASKSSIIRPLTPPELHVNATIIKAWSDHLKQKDIETQTE